MAACAMVQLRLVARRVLLGFEHDDGDTATTRVQKQRSPIPLLFLDTSAPTVLFTFNASSGAE